MRKPTNSRASAPMVAVTEDPFLLYSLDAEMTAIGSMLFGDQFASQVFDVCSEADFYFPAHRAIFAAMTELQ